MGKILGSQSGMRKYLEQEMLAESLKGRVRYGCTAYPGMDVGFLNSASMGDRSNAFPGKP